MKKNKRAKAPNSKSTLCWTCSNEAFSKCPWVLFGQPVKGWKAKKTEIKNRYSDNEEGVRVIQSMHIKSCPNYIKEEKRIKKQLAMENIKDLNCNPVKCINCKYAQVDKSASTKDWEAYGCTNKDSEYYKCLLNVTVDGNKQFKISWGGCEYGQADRRAI